MVLLLHMRHWLEVLKEADDFAALRRSFRLIERPTAHLRMSLCETLHLRNASMHLQTTCLS
jgi:hypothetical protein